MNNVNNGGLLERMQAEIIELRTKVEALENKVPRGFTEKDEMDYVMEPCQTPQEKRDEIIEKAKRDIAELKMYGYGNQHYLLNETLVCTAKFIVNKEKRTVVVLLKGASTERLRAKGIAKCAPDDCFNSAIGKAIALRRALGLEVPSEYTNAPQPTEVRVGDLIRVNITGTDKFFENAVISIEQPYDIRDDYGFDLDDGSYTSFSFKDGDKVIDDSRE